MLNKRSSFGLGSCCLALLGCAAATWRDEAPATAPADRAAPVTLPLRFGGAPGAVTLVHVGRIAVKRAHAELVVPRFTPTLLRFGQIFAAGGDFQPSLPILAGVIDHPEKRVLVDTGELTRFNDDADYYACDKEAGAIDHNLLRMTLHKDDEIDRQLARFGERAVSDIVLTHLHADHTGGVPRFPDARVFTSKVDVDLGSRGGAAVCRSLGKARLAYVDSGDDAVTVADDEVDRAFGRSVRLTSDGRVRALPLPGHTPGSLGVLVRADDLDVFFVGDVAFTEQQLRDRFLLGIHADFDAVESSMAAIELWAARHPTVVLPSHDDGAATRLLERRTLAVTR